MENTTTKITKVDLITGFLGAGKTTFIKKYSAYLQKKKISFAVIENEYGRAGVDTVVLRDAGVKTLELTGGCLCCTLLAGFHDMLLTLHEQGIERIIVEPSGIYEAAQFFSVMCSGSLDGKCETGTALCIVDPDHLDMYEQETSSFLKNQLLLSDGIIFSRTQLTKSETTEKAITKLKELAPAVPILFADDWSHLKNEDFEAFTDSLTRYREIPLADTSHSNIFQSTSLVIKQTFSREQLSEILTEIMSGNYGTILRCKGFLLSEHGAFSINTVPGQISIEEISGQVPPVLNIIGRNLNRDKLKKKLKHGGNENEKKHERMGKRIS